MATGAEHYLEAERLLERALSADAVKGQRNNVAEAVTHIMLEAAQVHATLALAAATAMAAEGTGVLLYGYGTGR